MVLPRAIQINFSDGGSSEATDVFFKRQKREAGPIARLAVAVAPGSKTKFFPLALALCVWTLSSSCAFGPRAWSHRDEVIGTVRLYWGEGRSTRFFDLVFFHKGWLELVDSATIDPLYYYRRPCFQLRESDFAAVVAAFGALDESPERVRGSRPHGTVLVGDFGSRPVEVRQYPLYTAAALAKHPDLERITELGLELGFDYFPKLFGKYIRTHPLAELLTPAQLDAPPRPGRKRCSRSSTTAMDPSAGGVGDQEVH